MKITGRNIAERLIQARGKITRKEISKKTGFHEQTIIKWETNKSKPSIENIEVLAKAYNVSPMILAFGYNKNTNDDKQMILINEILTLTPENKSIIEKITDGLKLKQIMNKNL